MTFPRREINHLFSMAIRFSLDGGGAGMINRSIKNG